MLQAHTIILAAGRGSRMKDAARPKVLLEVGGKPMIEHVISAVEAARPKNKPTVVIGRATEHIRDMFGDRVHIAVQPQPLGTGDAVRHAVRAIGHAPQYPTLILYGDHPLLSAQTISKIVAYHLANNNRVTLTSVHTDNTWEERFAHNGRIVRDTSGSITGIVEHRDATPDQRLISERNASYLCFDSAWLWQHIHHLQNENSQSEYYLTDLIYHAVQNKEPVSALGIDPVEALGVNTPQEYEHVLAKQ